MLDRSEVTDRLSRTRRMFKKAVQQGRSERGGEAYFVLYVEPLSDARTKLEDFFNILLMLGGAIKTDAKVGRTAD
jgi:hypothetical protein